MDTKIPTLPVFNIKRHRLTIDGAGVSTLVGAYGCPLQCRYCLNPHAWDPKTLEKCRLMTPEELYEEVKIDHLYFLATGGGITFGGGESLLHADFIRQFRAVCGPEWTLTAETSLNVPTAQLKKALEAINDFIVDIKDLNPSIYEAYTRASIRPVLDNLSLLVNSVSPEHIRIRVPKIPSFNTEKDINHSTEQLKKMGFKNLEVFPYIIRS